MPFLANEASCMTHDPLADFDGQILDFLRAAGIDPELVQLSTPERREFGERATNVAFQMAKERRLAPRQIAAEIAGLFDPAQYPFISAVEPAGQGFINFRLNYAAFTPHVLDAVDDAGDLFGRRPGVQCRHMVVEHTSVNPNKEWHAGHVRNAVLGDVIARLLRLEGHDVQVQNYIDDTGLQAAQAILGLTRFPEGREDGEKFDHYSGRHYVKIAGEIGAEKELESREHDAAAEARLENIQRLKRDSLDIMHALEHGEHHELLEQILSGQLETAYRLGVFYSLLIWESDLVNARLFDEAMQAIQSSSKVYRPEEGRYAGALVIETDGSTQQGDEPKAEVLIRSNGIPTYVGKDIAYAMWKMHVLPDRLHYRTFAIEPNGELLWSTALQGEARDGRMPERAINVIGVHQTQAQQTVKEALRVTGHPDAADRYIHLAYGMVRTVEGKISGRRGTATSGDAIIDEAVRVAYERAQEKRSQDIGDAELRRIAESVGIGAVRYFMSQYNPLREIIFDVNDVVSYDGNTGLYVQYALVRMFAILRRAMTDHAVGEEAINAADTSLLSHEQERRIIYHLAQYPGTVADASRTLSVNLIAEYAYDLANLVSQFYRDCPVLPAEPPVRNARLLLVRTTRDVLVNACNVLGVPILERL